MKAGRLKTVVVNKHKVKANAKHGTHAPVLSIHVSGRRVTYGHEIDVIVDGKVVATFFYRPEKPKSCGASVWFSTHAELRVRKTKPAAGVCKQKKTAKPRRKKRETSWIEPILEAAARHVKKWPKWMQQPEHRRREPAGNRVGWRRDDD